MTAPRPALLSHCLGLVSVFPARQPAWLVAPTQRCSGLGRDVCWLDGGTPCPPLHSQLHTPRSQPRGLRVCSRQLRGPHNWLLMILCLSKHLSVWVDVLCLRERGFQKLIHNMGLANTLSSGPGEGQA